MDEKRRSDLEDKRLKLKRVNHERSMLQLVSDFTQVLDSNTIDYEVIFESPTWSWVCDTFPVSQWGRINWGNVKDSNVLSWKSAEEVPSLFERIVAEYCLSDDLVTVIWSNAERPAIKMSFDDVRTVVQELFDEDWDSWIVSESQQWCIEYHHHGSLAIGMVK